MKDGFVELIRQALLAPGQGLPIADLVEQILDSERVRELCRRFDLRPRGFRIERASLDKLLPRLLEGCRDRAEVRDALASELAGASDRQTRSVTRQQARLDQLLERRLAELTAELERAREAAGRRQSKIEELSAALQVAQRDNQALSADRTRLQNELERLRRAQPAPRPASGAKRLEAQTRQIEHLEQQDQDHRQRIAAQAAEIRALIEEVEELRAKVPDWKRKQPPTSAARVPAGEFTVPRFSEDFYRSLAGRERRICVAVFQAVLTLCQEGPAYPGLETKRLEGHEDLWSIRATLKHRVYFHGSTDGSFLVVGVEDREDQPTYLKRRRRDR